LRTLRAERDERSKELAALDDMIAALEKHVAESAPENDRPKQHAARMAWEILKKNGPLSSNQIADLMLQRGYRTDARRFAGVVYQRMWSAPAWFKRQGKLWVARGNTPPYNAPAPGKVRRID
jgi:hypothetical protein